MDMISAVPLRTRPINRLRHNPPTMNDLRSPPVLSRKNLQIKPNRNNVRIFQTVATGFSCHAGPPTAVLPPPTIKMGYPPRFILLISRLLLFVSGLLFSSIPGGLSSGAVTLGSIQIFKTHEWIAPKPSVYFYCQGENKLILPDVKEKDFLYSFKGEESWQPLTELPEKKCKRCGLYEMDTVKSDDVFDEWELCSDDFVNGIYAHYKEKEFNATFTLPEYRAAVISAEKKLNIFLTVIISTLVSILVIVGIVALHNYWKKRKRQLDQARFLKLFEDPDDLDELDNF